MLQSIVVDVPVSLNNGDVIIFRNGKWIVQGKTEFLADVYAYVNEKTAILQQYISNVKNETNAQKEELVKDEQALENYKQEMNEYKAKINVKLKEHHNVLNALTGGDK